MGPKSARSTALYQTDAFSSTVTSPTRTAVGAMNADGCTTGDFPSKLHSGMGRALAVFWVREPQDVAGLGPRRPRRAADKIRLDPYLTGAVFIQGGGHGGGHGVKRPDVIVVGAGPAGAATAIL